MGVFGSGILHFGTYRVFPLLSKPQTPYEMIFLTNQHKQQTKDDQF